jgi:hypothetical protein
VTTYILSLNVVTTDEAHAVQTWEVFSRVGQGLALDGIDISSSINTVPEGADDEEGDAG